MIGGGTAGGSAGVADATAGLDVVWGLVVLAGSLFEP
jgi:hypothetical protein